MLSSTLAAQKGVEAFRFPSGEHTNIQFHRADGCIKLLTADHTFSLQHTDMNAFHWPTQLAITSGSGYLRGPYEVSGAM
jgi:hypothetical protein